MGENSAGAALVLLGLLLVCSGYAAVLERLHDRYVPDYVWLTVVVGNIFILAAVAILDTLGFTGWVWLFACDIAGGTPILIWQGWQAMQRRIERERLHRGRPAHAPAPEPETKEEHATVNQRGAPESDTDS